MIEIEEVPPLRSPVLIAAFEGWNDAADAASGVLDHLLEVWDSRLVAVIDPEDFYDFQMNRPIVGTDEQGQRRITWPSTQLSVASPPGAARDVILLRGIEPNMRWRGFCEELRDIGEQLGVELVVTLGALLADSPHTRPVPVSGTASDPETMDALGLERSRYEGPTGIVGVLHDSCRRADLASASLWAAVPHYASLAASPRAALALCERLADLLGTEFDLGDLERASAAYEQQVSEAVSADEETEAYVQELEARRDALGDEFDVPSGDSLAAELTRFLREHEARRAEEEEEEEGP